MMTPAAWVAQKWLLTPSTQQIQSDLVTIFELDLRAYELRRSRSAAEGSNAFRWNC